MRGFAHLTVVAGALALLSALSVSADDSARPSPLVCVAPISTCSAPHAGGLGDCPDGYVCRCVPSCPNCNDCDAKVCVAAVEPQCRTACDCSPGLGCFDGRCIAGFAPVFCCEQGACPSGDQCQHSDARMDHCPTVCTNEVWRCQSPGANDPACGDARECRCTSSCPGCEDCGSGVCLPGDTPPPYRCDSDTACNEGDRCQCVSSCPDCDDCAFSVCVPRCGSDCDAQQHRMTERISAVLQNARSCQENADCVMASTATQCHRTCNDLTPINKQFVSKLHRLIERIDQRLCSRYRGMGCAALTAHCPHKPFATLSAACVDGQCVGVRQHKP